MSQPADAGMPVSVEQLPPPNFLAADSADLVVDAPPRRPFRLLPFVLAVLAWGVVLGYVVWHLVEQNFVEESPPKVAAKDSLNLYVVRTQARYLLGTREWMAGTSAANDAELYKQIKALNTGPVDQRIRFIILAGELEGPHEALTQLTMLEKRLQEKQVPLTSAQSFQLRTLRKLYTDYAHLRYDAPSVSDAERQQLREQLDWFGELALAPARQPGAREIIAAAGVAAAHGLRDEQTDPEVRNLVLQPARRVFLVFLAVFGGVLGFAFVGFIMLVCLGFLMYLGQVRGGLVCGVSPAGVYAETFALWIMLFIGMSYGAAWLPLGQWRFLATGLGALFSLAALLWPWLRGIPFRQLREDIGWTGGRQPALEPAAGIAAYVMTLPLLLVGLLVVLALTALQNLVNGTGTPGPDDFNVPNTPTHPVVIYLARGSWWMRLQVYFLASVVAPVVEETMFRGVLYRHLRELTCRLDWLPSVLFSALISSFFFAIIHPQGVLAVPALMALACGFALAREWRGTLIPGMVAHGLNNGLVLTLTVVMLGD